MAFFIYLISFLIFLNSFSKSPSLFFFVFVLCSCLSSYMLEILPVLLLNKFLYTSGLQSSYHFISVIASSASHYFEKQTIACFFLSCLFFFYFVAFYSFIFLYYSLQFLCAEVFFKCNKNRVYFQNILFCILLHHRRSMFFHPLFVFGWFFLYQFFQFMFLLNLHLN